MTTTHDVPMPEPNVAYFGNLYYTADQVRDTAVKYADARCAKMQEAHDAKYADLLAEAIEWRDVGAELQAQRDALAEKVKAMEDNDRRYRWLRDESNFANKHAPAVVSCPLDDDLKRILVDSELDAAIDAAGGQA